MTDVGKACPSFSLPALSADGESALDPKKYAGSYLVLYFYPKDDTPGCTREAQAFTAKKAELAKLGAHVVGVSRDTIAKHKSFQAKYKLSFPLVSDPDRVAHLAFGAWGEKTMYGKKIEGALRSTFVIGPDRKVVRVFRNVKVDGHADAVLDAIRAHKAGDAPAKPAAKATKPAPSAAPKAAKAKAAPAAKAAPKKAATKIATKTTRPQSRKK
jgi:thioredoxin-dependent peroxiredoxin